MKLRTANAFWLVKNGLMNVYPSLRESIACDVLVVGGGISGALMAFQLSSEGYRTVLIDRGDVALGSTSATTAMLQYELDQPLCTLVKSLGKAPAVDIYAAGVEAIQKIGALISRLGIDCGFRKKESVYIARRDEDREWLQREYDIRSAAGLDVKWLTGQDILRTYNMKGKGAIRSASGGSLDAYRLTHGLLKYSVDHYGLQVYDHTGLAGVDSSGPTLKAQTDGGNRLMARSIVYATGYEAQAMMREKIVDLLSTYVCISEPMDHLPPHVDETIFWTTDRPYLYMRSTPDKRILIGGEDEPFQDAATRDNAIDKKETALIRQLRDLAPGLHFVPDFTWAGTFGVTPDSLPYIGAHEDYPGSFFVLGYGGNGITFSVLAMGVISDAIAGRANRFLDYFRFKR
jgi:glycine/D-amino acid oxidase-like deaminating enzyme